MNLQAVLDTVDGILVYQDVDLDMKIHSAFGADLMSDVLRFGREDTLLITGLTNTQAVRTAEMVGIRALLFVRAKIPPPETIALAKEVGVALLATQYTMYEASGLLYKAGLTGIGSCGDFA